MVEKCSVLIPGVIFSGSVVGAFIFKPGFWHIISKMALIGIVCQLLCLSE